MTDFHKILTLWYQQNKRDLPWRLNNDPYSVWVSEIILQQTRIDQGTNYFTKFINRFPDIYSLAVASENEILKMWQGLGYYSRARNMHHTAGQIVNKYNSRFPESYNELKKLKGIGEYTAAAIASISFGAKIAVVDGNVSRVLSRIFGIATPIDTSKGKKELAALANSLLNRQNPGQFNEALMDFGALQCTPRNPCCSECPFVDKCVAFVNNKVGFIPFKSKQIIQKNRFFNYLFINYKEYFFLEQRKAKDIWHNLYHFPLIETDEPVDKNILISLPEFKNLIKGSKVTVENYTPEITHLLTHQRLHIRFFHIRLTQLPENCQWIITENQEITKFPVPKPIEKYLSRKFKHHLIM